MTRHVFHAISCVVTLLLIILPVVLDSERRNRYAILVASLGLLAGMYGGSCSRCRFWATVYAMPPIGMRGDDSEGNVVQGHAMR